MTVRLLHYSDLEHAFDDPSHVARFASLVADRRDDRTVVLGSGDDTAPSVLGLTANGRQALDFFNAVDTDFETFGNHDFDHGITATHELVRDAPNEWLTANISYDGARFAETHTKPWSVLDVDDHRVGVVGVTTADTTVTNPRAAALTVTDPFEAAADAIDELRSEGVEFVVVLAHVGDPALAGAVDADVVLDGHVHDARISTEEGTLYVRSAAGGTQLNEIALTTGDDPTVTRHTLSEADVTPDETLETILRERIVDTGLDEVVASADDPVARDESAVDCGGSPIGNFVTDSLRWATDADVAVVPAGGFRVGLPLSGQVTAFDLRGLAPFDDEYHVVECTGAELRTVVTELSPISRGGTGAEPDGSAPVPCFGHVSGMAAEWDADRGAVDELRVGGDPVCDDATYTLATVAYFLETDRTLAPLGPEDVVATYEGENPFVAYARVNGIEPRRENRIRRVTRERR